MKPTEKRNIHPLVYTRNNILSRCHNSNNPSYEYYGGRGVILCDEWRNDVSSFVKWGKNNGWERGLEIDRIDNDKGYFPENCRFVTRTENCRNQRTSRYWWVDGVRYESSRDASEKLGIARIKLDEWCNGGKDGCYSELKYKEKEYASNR